MKIKSIFLYVILVVLAGSVFLVSAHQRHIRRDAMERLEQHARVIASALWKYETEDPAAYLRLATELNHYRQITVVNDYQDDLISVTGPVPGKTERFLIRMGLIPVVALKTPVVYRDTDIGEIRAQWYNKAIYSYMYAAFCLVLIFALFWFFLSLTAAKKKP